MLDASVLSVDLFFNSSITVVGLIFNTLAVSFDATAVNCHVTDLLFDFG